MRSEQPSPARRFLLFAIGGGLGFVVDSLVLHGLLHLGANLYTGRLLSFLCAVLATWLFNRNRTFRERRSNHGLLGEALRYLLAMSAGGALNLSCYALLVHYWELARNWPVLAVAVGCLAGMLVNFASSSLWVFRGIAAGEPGRDR
ncbi:GtrA family protein [Pseudomonas schmalbachii]|uniref:GtrA family protein n=1 Tax=Pseudomonas schmalbachii TaxID=2816993 RepID=A0ABS3TVX3_9PSED|nr:GtrA family protein [Pseudomonas schmalbachii]MBO3276810.1 GtrA family protein [Pseudomonas schmalbachii]